MTSVNDLRSSFVDYFARNGDWSHQWVVLSNLVALLRRIGDSDMATSLADATAAGDRGTALDIARKAIDRNRAP